ncbi:hypothetical protein DPPLL_01920 [Desulfofustis limnaeus]|uniref:Uncharacterized protein n=1 Tax=Desulfofustis limnaeus TaxID=2740163 RepID=A0ABM7W4J8_9BACT|nr:hypothetical protein DPPLL_01920 [Desulfofustis limnaeus]
MGHGNHALFWHTVTASKIASIGDGQAQIADRPVEIINERGSDGPRTRPVVRVLDEPHDHSFSIAEGGMVSHAALSAADHIVRMTQT